MRCVAPGTLEMRKSHSMQSSVCVVIAAPVLDAPGVTMMLVHASAAARAASRPATIILADSDSTTQQTCHTIKICI